MRGLKSSFHVVHGARIRWRLPDRDFRYIRRFDETFLKGLTAEEETHHLAMVGPDFRFALGGNGLHRRGVTLLLNFRSMVGVRWSERRHADLRLACRSYALYHAKSGFGQGLPAGPRSAIGKEGLALPPAQGSGRACKGARLWHGASAPYAILALKRLIATKL